MKVKGVERKYLGVHLKHPKEERLSEGITIEVFEIEGQHSWACPVKAYEEYLKCGHQGTGKLPLIRTWTVWKRSDVSGTMPEVSEIQL